MRPIKFRQPIFRKGSFVQWHYWGFLSKGLFVAPSDDSVNWEKSQQFTGLLDKNGKEIWEGDLLTESTYPNDVRKCLWFEEGAGFIFQAVKDPNWIWCPNSESTQRGFKVIGDIYSNPELLSPQTGKEVGK